MGNVIKMKRIYTWGTGKIANYIYQFYKEKLEAINVVGCIDNDKKKEGKLFWNVPIYMPSILNDDRDCYIIVLTTAFDEIRQQIIENYPWLSERIESPLFITKQRLISRYEKVDNAEISDIVKYLRNHPLKVFNYDFTSKYDRTTYDILFDSEAKLYYTIYESKRMYFARYLNTEESVRNYYKQIIMEQDIDSPHRYLTEQFYLNEDSVVVDAGVAEGNFALSVIDKVNKIYLFEPDSDWVEALRYTFAPYADKVIIINKYLSNYTDESTVSLDTYMQGRKVDFIKMDIEGEEYHALEGATKTISLSEKMKCVVCSYHQEYDYIALSQLLQEQGFVVEPSKGYMWFPYDRDSIYSLPTLRRGLIRAQK